MRGRVPVQRDFLGCPTFFDGLLQEPLGDDNIASCTQEKVNGLPITSAPCVIIFGAQLTEDKESFIGNLLFAQPVVLRSFFYL